MSGKTVIVTGGSRGLGRATAFILGHMGANVVLAARSNKELKEAADEINRSGGRALAVSGDLRRPKTCQKVVEEAVKRFNGIDGLVNNAGILGPLARIADAEPSAWTENWEINLLCPAMITKYALPLLRASKGRVIHISSGMAVKPVAGTSAYNVAKAGLNMFSATLAIEEPLVTTIALRPGGVDTDVQATLRAEGAEAMDPEVYKKYSTRELLPPEIPGRAVAVLSLYAPSDWSGRFISYDDEDVQTLVEKHSK